MSMKDNRFCLICLPKNRTLYYHLDEKSGLPWIWCNKCARGYSLEQYCKLADVDMDEFIKNGIEIVKDQEDEVNVLSWPKNFIPLSDPRAEKGIQYIKSRGLSTDGDMYYDLDEEGIVFPYYYQNHFCGAQVRFIDERVKDDGSKWKITTMSGTRLGMLFGLWNQSKLFANIKGIVICEGYFNALALQQAFNIKYGGVSNNPWKFICASGSGVSDHQAKTLKDLKEQGYKVIGAFDTDEAGLKGINKMEDAGCLTHYSLTGDSEKDWNDLLKDLGHEEFAKLFLSKVKAVDVKD